MERSVCLRIVAASFLLGMGTAAIAADCTKSSTGLVPLTDLGADTYFGLVGGLYPGGSNSPPASHYLAGKAIADSIVPLDAQGNPDPQNGLIVLVSVGMSNTSQEFTRFMQLMNGFPLRHPQLVIVNGAQGGQDVNQTANPDSNFWNVLKQRLAQAGCTPEQVQIVWLKQVQAQP